MAAPEDVLNAALANQLQPVTPLPEPMTDEELLRARLKDASRLDNTAFNRARRFGPAGMDPAVVAKNPQSLEPSELDRNVIQIRDRKALRERILLDPDFSRSVERTWWDRLVRTYDKWSWQGVEYAIDAASAGSFGVKRTERAFRGMMPLADALTSSFEPYTQRNKWMDTDDNQERRRQLSDDMGRLDVDFSDYNLIAMAPLELIKNGPYMAANTVMTVGATAVAGPAGTALGLGASYANTFILEAGDMFVEQADLHPDVPARDLAAASVVGGSLIAAIELIPLGRLSSTFTKSSMRLEANKLLADRTIRTTVLPYVGMALLQGGTEYATEFPQELINISVEQFGEVRAGNKTPQEATEFLYSKGSLDRAHQAGIAAMSVGFLLGGASSAAGSYKASGHVQTAQTNRDAFQALHEKSLEDADIREAIPDMYHQLVDEASAEAGVIDGVYINPNELVDAYENEESTGALQTLLDNIPDLGNQIVEAQESGAKVRLTTGEFATYVAGSDQFAALANHFSFGPDQLSLNEARAAEQTDAIERVKARLQEITSQNFETREESTTEQDIERNLSAVFQEELGTKKPLADNASKIFARMVSGIAREAGMDPLAIAANEVFGRTRFELREALEPVTEEAAEVLDQPEEAPAEAAEPVEAEVPTPVRTIAQRRSAAIEETFDQPEDRPSARGRVVVNRRTHEFLVQLSKSSANDSTLMHELSHLALELTLDVSEMEGAEARIVGFAQEIMDWLGVESRRQITRTHHEKFAQSLEVYLIEGEAPSADLRGAFAYFRSRLTSIYRNIRAELPDADHDMAFTAIFDRLLATEDELRAERAGKQAVSAFGASTGNLTAAEQAQIDTALTQARDAERAKLERTIALEQDRVLQAQRSEIKEEVEERVFSEPIQQARHWLKFGTLPLDRGTIDGVVHEKLSAPAVDSIAGDQGEFRRTLPRGTWQSRGGLAPDLVATSFGFSSPTEFLVALADSQRPDDLIAEQVQAEAERRGVTATRPELQAMAAEDLEGASRDRLYAVERRVARRLARQAPALARAAEERAAAGEPAATPAEVAERRDQAAEAVEEAAETGEAAGEAQVEAIRARASQDVAQVARRDQAAARRRARDFDVLSPAVVRRLAREEVGKVKVRDLAASARRWEAARARASNGKIDASLARDWAKADELITAEQWSHALAGAAAGLVIEKEKWQDYLKTFSTSRKRGRLNKVPFEAASREEDGDLGVLGKATWFDAIDGLLEQVNLSTGISLRKLDNAESLLLFAKQLESSGTYLNLPEWVYARNPGTNFRNMTVDEFQDVHDSVKSIERNALFEIRQTEGEAKEDFANKVEQMQATLAERFDVDRTRQTREIQRWDALKGKSRDFLASHTSFETIMDYLDGDVAEGAFNSLLNQPLQDAYFVQRDIWNEANERVSQQWNKYTKRERQDFYNLRIFIESLGDTLSKNAIVAIAANMGNTHNLNALRESTKFALTDEQLQEILTHITDKDADLIEEVQRLFDETLWPKSKALEERMNGVAPRKVPAEPFLLPPGRDGRAPRWMTGGYFPVVFDNSVSEQAHRQTIKTDMSDLFPGIHAHVQTRHGMLKERKATSGGLTIMPDFMSVVSRHIDLSAKDIAYREAVIESDRLIKAIEPDLKRVLGTEFYRSLRPYLQRMASSYREGRNTWGSKILGSARQGVGVFAMGWRVSTAMIQLGGSLPAAAIINPWWVYRGYQNLFKSGHMVRDFDIGGWRKIFERVFELRELIPDLKDRAASFDREAQEAAIRKNPVDVRNVPGSVKSIRAFTTHYAYWMLGLVDTITATAVAGGALEKALEGRVEGIEAADLDAAVRYAGKIVRRTQGSGAVKDLPGAMDGGELEKLLTVFMTYANTQAQLALKLGLVAKEGAPKDWGRFLAFFGFTYIVEPIVSETIRQGLKQIEPDPPDEDEYWEQVAFQLVSAPFGGLTLLRDIVPYTWKGFEPGSNLTTQFQIWSAVWRETIAQPFTGDFDGEQMTRAWANFLTYTTGAPTKEIMRWSEIISREEFGRGR